MMAAAISAPKSRFLRFPIVIAIGGPTNAASQRHENAKPHCDLRVRWKIASDRDFELRFPSREPFPLN